MKLRAYLCLMIFVSAVSCSRLPLKRVGLLQKFAARLGLPHDSPSQGLTDSLPVGVFFKVPPIKAARSPQFSPAQGSPLQSAPVQGFPQQSFPAQGSIQQFIPGGRSPQESIPAQGSEFAQDSTDFSSVGGQSLGQGGSAQDFGSVGGQGLGQGGSAQDFGPIGGQGFGQGGPAQDFGPIGGSAQDFGPGGFGPGAAPINDLGPADAGEVVDAADDGSATRYPETPIWGNRPVNRHFDSVKFCEYFMIPSESPINSYSTMRLRFYDNYDIMRCLAASEIIALPYNLVQDVRWAFNQIGRQSDPLAATVQVAALPFVMTRTVAALPVRAVAEFYKLSRRFVESQGAVTRKYVK